MNILICSKNSAFCSQIIQRLKKERHEIYLITGSTGTASPEQEKSGAFQEYRFSYSNEYLSRIMRNANPDLLLILGAFDPLYSWRDEQKQSIEYISGMTNLLMAAKNSGVERVVYLSTLDVFEGNAQEVLDRATAPVPESLRLRTLVRAEALCSEFSDEEMQIAVVRLPLVYGASEKLQSRDVCLRMVSEYLEDGQIQCRPFDEHTAMYLGDAVEVVCTLAKTETLQPLYQLKGHTFSEDWLAQELLSMNLKEGACVLKEEGEALPNPAARVADTQEEELHFRMRYSMQEGIHKLCETCLQVQRKAQKQEKKEKSFWSNWGLPVLESVLLFLVIHIVSLLLHNTWVGENLNLYVLYVLAIAVTYGTGHALFATVLGAGAQLSLFVMDHSLSAVLTDYGFFIGVLQMLVIGVMGGYMRDKYKRKNQDLADENAYLSSELSDITRINDSNLVVKDIYEKRLVSYKNSLAKIYEITSELDFMESRKVIFRAVHVISQLMEMKDVAIYISSRHSSFFRLAAASTQLAASAGKSLRFDENSYLYSALSQREVYQNQRMEEGKPTFAGGVYEDEAVTAIVMVWTNELEKINLYQSNLLVLLCRLIEKAIHRAVLYEESVYQNSYLEGGRIMKEDAFKTVIETFREGKSQGLLSYTLLEVELAGKQPSVIEKLVRDTDVIGMLEGKPCVLLANSSVQDAQFVVKRFEENGVVPTIADESLQIGA